MSTRSEGNELVGITDVGLALEIFLLQTSHVDQHFLRRRLACQRRNDRFTRDCRRVHFYGMGHGSTFQIPLAYS
jgi:hypothetical protein